MDLIEIERIERALGAPRFRERVYTEAERAYCDGTANPLQSYAARFAGKEAVGKALGCGVDFSWREIEIVGRPKPKVTLPGGTQAFAERLGVVEIDVSLTHSTRARRGGRRRAAPRRGRARTCPHATQTPPSPFRRASASAAVASAEHVRVVLVCSGRDARARGEAVLVAPVADRGHDAPRDCGPCLDRRAGQHQRELRVGAAGEHVALAALAAEQSRQRDQEALAAGCAGAVEVDEDQRVRLAALAEASEQRLEPSAGPRAGQRIGLVVRGQAIAERVAVERERRGGADRAAGAQRVVANGPARARATSRRRRRRPRRRGAAAARASRPSRRSTATAPSETVCSTWRGSPVRSDAVAAATSTSSSPGASGGAVDASSVIRSSAWCTTRQRSASHSCAMLVAVTLAAAASVSLAASWAQARSAMRRRSEALSTPSS